ncbi:uncharacterized protein LOC143350692 [Colletes latitarsis]|uniref:uncharacterized protein LOC143350692 n=1 Tax=Colletes latitarsis TaxID=2605962 RepID=UPI0040374389
MTICNGFGILKSALPQKFFLQKNELAKIIIQHTQLEVHLDDTLSHFPLNIQNSALERSLDKHADRKAQYRDFLNEYEKPGHMTEIQDERIGGCYLPHHPVVKTDSITTKIRVVFDASARSSSGTSLNDILMVGPTIQDDLFAIIMRFRLHKYVLTADITKMYRQIDLNINDRRYHKILWRESINEPIKTYQLNTVTYGTASAPYLAIRTLQQLAHDEGHSFPLAARSFRKDFYVDDVLTGAETIDQAIKLRDELIKLSAKGCFELRQWVSNEPKLIESLRKLDNTEHIALDTVEAKKTLGLYWNANKDTLGYSLKQAPARQKITKRTILARVAQLFDPLGLLGPIIVQAKLIMQDLWKCQVDWDEDVPIGIRTAWTTFHSQLQNIRQIQIPRRVIADNTKNIQLHGFCDASERAYGACIYIRSTDSSHQHISQLLCSKSRVAPLKTQSLPRLELCAAVLLIKLYNMVVKILQIEFQTTTFWSDSTIVLHWINTTPHTLKPFVANRVNQIQKDSRYNQWRHVPSECNAADVLSRGLNPTDIINHPTWYRGPQWLSQSEDTWPYLEIQPIEIPEKRKVIVLKTTTHTDFPLLEKYSSFTTLKRVIAYCLRFINNTQKQEKHAGHLTTNELTQATVKILALVQEIAFPRERQEIMKSPTHTQKNKLTALDPFIDTNGILRVGGRLKHSIIPHESKHPAILPHHHHITNLIIREAHIKHGHSGMQGTLNAVRQAFWPINGRVVVKSIIKKCITCQRMEPAIPRYPMGQLPGNRVRFIRPFLVAGVDYCGPLYIKEKKHRNTKKLKTYVAIFVCFSTKAVHIELVSDLTSDAFLAALKRFFARRGKCTDIYSDNATTFTGADRELKAIHKTLNVETNNNIHKYLANNGINWHFIPPRAPHFGGLWEAAVKSCKRHLIRLIGNNLFTFEELSTCLIEIEAILNSRPLTPLSSDPNDLTPLTPGHFLIGDSITSTSVCDLTSLKAGRLSSWQQVQQIRQHFWKRWYKEYLNELTVRKKWHHATTSIVKEGMLVMLKDDNTPPLHWPMGRIIAIHPGEDGIIRVVTVKTTHGEYKRNVKGTPPSADRVTGDIRSLEIITLKI